MFDSLSSVGEDFITNAEFCWQGRQFRSPAIDIKISVSAMSLGLQKFAVLMLRANEV